MKRCYSWHWQMRYPHISALDLRYIGHQRYPYKDLEMLHLRCLLVCLQLLSVCQVGK